MYVKRLLISVLLVPLLLAIANPSESMEITNKEININDILFPPSSMTTAIKDNITFFTYLRTDIKESETPTNIEKTIKDAERIVGIRLKNWGFMVGWQGSKKIDIEEPYILAIDYKIPFSPIKGISNALFDFKYSTKKIAKSNIRQSILDFGVFSITGLISKEITPFFELYGGLSANYAYLDMSSETLTDLWKYVPLAGFRIYLSNYYDIQIILEASRGRLNSNDAVWIWNLGMSIGF